MKKRLGLGLFVLACWATPALAESFHIEIPMHNKHQLKNQLAYKQTSHDYRAGLTDITRAGNVVFGSQTIYFLDGEYAVEGTASTGASTFDGVLEVGNGPTRFSLYRLSDALKQLGGIQDKDKRYPVGEFPEHVDRAIAYDISFDGTIVVGEMSYDDQPQMDLIELPDGTIKRIYSNGRTVPYRSDAIWWSEETGFKVLPRPKNWRPDGLYRAMAIARDGNTVLGHIHNNTPPYSHFQPVMIDLKSNKVTPLGHLHKFPDAKTVAVVFSADGKVFAGDARSLTAVANGLTKVGAFVWRKGKGYKLLPRLADAENTYARYQVSSMNEDGSLILGKRMEHVATQSKPRETGVIWVNDKVQTVAQYLTDRGIDLHGWDLTRATDISLDGKILGGNASGEHLQNVAWFAYLGEEELSFPVHDASMTLQQAYDYQADSRKPGPNVFDEQPAQHMKDELADISGGEESSVDDQQAEESVADEVAEVVLPAEEIEEVVEVVEVALIEPTIPPPEASQAKSLVGCWQWSNGLPIKVEANGTASHPAAIAQWKANSATEFEIDWPDFFGHVTLAADGNSLEGIDSIGIETTAQRLNGAAGSFAGVWQWSNGGVVTVAPDGAMSVGPLQGSWIKEGARYKVVWPILDKITVAANGKSLYGQNQFGTFTASKSASCN